MEPTRDNSKDTGNGVMLSGAGTYSVASAGELPSLCLITATMMPESPEQGDFGLWFKGSDDFERAYYIRFEPNAGRMVFDKWPRERSEVISGFPDWGPTRRSF